MDLNISIFDAIITSESVSATNQLTDIVMFDTISVSESTSLSSVRYSPGRRTHGGMFNKTMVGMIDKIKRG